MLQIVLIIILSILTIILLSGKGGRLIACYNVLDKEEKAQYNKKKLSRVMGVILSYIDLALMIDFLWGKYLTEHMGVVFIGGMLGGILCIFIAIRIWKA